MTFFLEVVAGALAVAIGICTGTCAPSIARWIRSRADLNEAKAEALRERP